LKTRISLIYARRCFSVSSGEPFSVAAFFLLLCSGALDFISAPGRWLLDGHLLPLSMQEKGGEGHPEEEKLLT